jgi:hypothetical protein
MVWRHCRILLPSHGTRRAGRSYSSPGQLWWKRRTRGHRSSAHWTKSFARSCPEYRRRRSRRHCRRNHPSWENDEDAKRALGPVIAKWLASGVLEYVAWDDRTPILLQPCGAVPKGTAPFYRLITDARFANKIYSDWGLTYTIAAQLSSTLSRCDFHFSIDISDAYHLSRWAGCGGELRPVKRPVTMSNGPGQPNEVSFVEAMVNGCTPSTCRGGCDKDLSGIMIDGFVFRFAALPIRAVAACQFGQKTAGSLLGSIVRAVARYFARAARRGCPIPCTSPRGWTT